MRVEREMDAGPSALVRRTPIGAHETTGELTERLAALAADAIAEARRSDRRRPHRLDTAGRHARDARAEARCRRRAARLARDGRRARATRARDGATTGRLHDVAGRALAHPRRDVARRALRRRARHAAPRHAKRRCASRPATAGSLRSSCNAPAAGHSTSMRSCAVIHSPTARASAVSRHHSRG